MRIHSPGRDIYIKNLYCTYLVINCNLIIVDCKIWCTGYPSPTGLNTLSFVQEEGVVDGVVDEGNLEENAYQVLQQITLIGVTLNSKILLLFKMIFHHDASSYFITN